MSLLLLRAVFGTAVLVEGGYYMREPNPTWATWTAGGLALLAGSFLVVGFLTPIIGSATVVGAIILALAPIPPTTPNLFDSHLTLTFASTILVAVIALGPGAFSIDALVFGRREIIIPPSQTRPTC